jgi:L-ribulokinase
VKPSFVIGLDFGTDSVRALVVDTANGTEISNGVHYYTRWKQKKYCDAARSQFRQHPLDYMEGIEESVRKALSGLSADMVENIKAIGIDTTGSTPAPVHESGKPLALIPEFAEEPDAMFVLWKDHTAQQEAKEINELAHSWEIDYTKYSGGDYSPEWFWSKILHITRHNTAVRRQAVTWVEQSDWIPALLTGNTNPLTWKRNRCAAGHKAMWHESFEGLPSREFLNKLHPALGTLRENLYSDTFESDTVAGIISSEWSAKLGLPRNVVITTGILDAHAGAVGANIEAYTMVKVTGTSTCDMVVVPREAFSNTLVKGICGQVNGSIIPGMLGLEAGQSAFGDLYSWFINLLLFPFETIGNVAITGSNESVETQLFRHLNAKAALLPVKEDDMVALDWINGRRTPDMNLGLKAAIAGLQLGTDAVAIYKSLVEATAFGSRAIIERFGEEKIPIEKVVAVGGISKKSDYVMQVLANVLNRPIVIAGSDQICALGAAIFAAKAANIYPSFKEAQQAMAGNTCKEYFPESAKAQTYDKLYLEYISLGRFASGQMQKK